MIKITINNIEYKLKNSYDEITFEEYLKLLQNNDKVNRNIENINLLSNIPVYLITDFVYELCKPHIEFLIATELFRCDMLPKEIEKIKVAEESFIKIETAKMIIKNNDTKNFINCIAPIVEIYSNINISGMLVRKALPIANYFMLEIENFFNSFNRLNDYKPSVEELSAGLKQMEYLGFYATLDALTHSDITKREQVKEMCAFEVYNQLLVDFEKSMYQKRLTEKQFKK